MENENILKEYAKNNFVPIILDESRQFLENICKNNEFFNILEIGTAIGYSGTLILKACKNAHLTTIEKNESSFNLAKETFKKENLSERVTSILGDAGEVIGTLSGNFDLIFLDGPKAQYIKYLPTLLNLLSIGGTLVADNIFFKGMVKSDNYPTHKHRTIVFNLRKFINEITNNPNLETSLFDIGDGISVSKKIR